MNAAGLRGLAWIRDPINLDRLSVIYNLYEVKLSILFIANQLLEGFVGL